MRRASILILLGLILLLPACSPGAQALPRGEGIVILLAPGAAGVPLRAAAEAYEAETGAPVTFLTLPADQYADRVSAYLLSSQSTVDLLYLPPGERDVFSAYRALYEASPGEPAWVPQREVEALWARADWLSVAGIKPPASLGEVYAAAEALARPPERYGIALAGAQYDAGFDYTSLTAMVGFSPVTGPPLLPPARESGAAVYRDLLVNGLALPSSPSLSRGDVLAALRDGKAALGFLPLTAADDLLKCPGAPSCDGGRSLLEPLPLGTAEDPLVVLREGGWAIPLKAARAADARKLVEALHSPGPVQDAFILAGGFPISSDPLSPEVLARRPYLDRFHPARGILEPFPDLLQSQSSWSVFHETVHRLAAGEIAPAEAAGRIDDEIHAARERLGR